ncbi:PPOX class F420-dependent oxidoreductase [Candidatus Nitrosocosmicus sp. SS]|jgi:PPOX class probable F420-dependent enzyme|nr:PPOX class F420-dependent oxidoreductase [Candidatus Nitrosocosmicus sp. SS]KAF0868639.1 PPOX class F420-dependent oxidoreductase [Candidatus Nitrosocosmicus sp. SS]
MDLHDNKNFDSATRKFFEDKNIAFVTTLMKYGSPQITPVWIDIADDSILINTAMGRVKQKNIEKDPRIAISVVDRNNIYHMVSIRGEVTEQITGQEAEDHIDKMAKKYLDKDTYPLRIEGEERILLKVTPKKVAVK